MIVDRMKENKIEIVWVEVVRTVVKMNIEGKRGG